MYFNAALLQKIRKILTKYHYYDNNIDNSKLVFIIGVPRSGTTWLWGLLTSCPDIESLTREDFDSANPSIVNKQRITSETGAFVRYNNRTIRRVVRKKISLFPNKVIIEKTPSHILHIRRIIKLFPTAKIIYIMRDPRAVISSMLHSKFFHFANSVEEALTLYTTYINAAKPYLHYKNLYLVKYEDLIAQPRVTLQKILQFIGVKATLQEVQQAIIENYRRVKVNIKGVFRKGQVDSYKQDLTKDQIMQVETALSDIIQEYRY